MRHGERGWGERVWLWLIRAVAPRAHRDALLGDVEEELGVRARRDGSRAARRWLAGQALRSVGPGLRGGLAGAVHGLGANDPEGEGATMWMNDLRLAVRSLLRRPGFAATVVLTLALGVGATTALFGVFRGVFLEPLPLPDSEEIVVVMETGNFGCCGPASGPDYVDWTERQRSFDDMALLSPGSYTLTGLDEPERVYATRVSANVFGLLGVEPVVGRALTDDDDPYDGAVLLGYDLWQRAFGGEPGAVGRSLEIDGRARTVVGVMPPDFDVPSPWIGTRRHALYLPIDPDILQGNRGNHSFPVIARLTDGVTLDMAQADMERVMRELAVEYPRTNADRSTRVFTMHDYLYGDYGDQLLLILGAAALVLLIACANVAGLLLARGAGREGELAVRSALGASRGTIVRLLFSESLVLAGIGGVLGIVVAFGAMDALRSLLPATMPRIQGLSLDASALGFAVAISVGTALVFGMVPALLAARTDLAAGVREGGRGTLAPSKERVRDAFIVAQIAFGLVLANGAGLLVRSYAELRRQEYGFRSEGVLTLALVPDGPRYEDQLTRLQYYERVTESVSEVAGVRGVGFVSRLPLAGGSNGNVQVEGWAPRANNNEGPLVEVTSVVGDYFGTVDIPLLQGRLLEPDDSIPGSVGVVVNQAMVDRIWPEEDPVGRRFSFDEGPPWLTVVGVVGSVRQWGPEQAALPQAYLPFTRGWSGSGYLTVRLEGDPAQVVPAVRAAVLDVDPTQPPSDVRGMDERLEASFAQRRFYTTLIGLFALAALFLASAGIYGTVSYFVARRTRELGIRIALGAARSGVVGLVVRRGVRLAVWGVALGLLGVWATLSTARTVVYGVSALDPVSLLVGCLVLGLAAVSASALPATRAVRVSPTNALRTE
jgi:putative ABC transport system permease protein